MRLRDAEFALRVVRRRNGDAGILYRRTLTEYGRERLERVTSISPLALLAGAPLLRAAVRASEGSIALLKGGTYHPLERGWGAKVTCYALVASGLRDGDKLNRAAASLARLEGIDAAWWLGLMANGMRTRAVRALRILTEAVK